MQKARFVSFLFLSFLVFAPGPHGQAANQGQSAEKFENALRIIEQHALHLPSRSAIEQSRAIADPVLSLKALFASVDGYSAYVDSEEAQRMKKARAHTYSGVGMDILQTADGEFLCLPFFDGPAERGGVLRGDVVRAVDGIAVKGSPMARLEELVRGPEGTTVRLDIVRAGQAHSLSLERAAVVRSSADLFYDPELSRIQITHFDTYTPLELKSCLDVLAEGANLVLDLRANAGGDLHAALECVEFFVPPGTHMLSMHERAKEATRFIARGNTPKKLGKILIWTDQYTASAAEVFAAALTQNKKAHSLGGQTFGKGVSQRVIPEEAGAYFLLTVGLLVPPSGVSYQKVGLKPDYLMPPLDEMQTTEAFMEMSESILNPPTLKPLNGNSTPDPAEVSL